MDTETNANLQLYKYFDRRVNYKFHSAKSHLQTPNAIGLGLIACLVGQKNNMANMAGI
jgi:hypothetical protein